MSVAARRVDGVIFFSFSFVFLAFLIGVPFGGRTLWGAGAVRAQR